MKKTITILFSLVILLGLAGVYFLFPGALFDFLMKAERSVGGLKQRSIDVKGVRIEYSQDLKSLLLIAPGGVAFSQPSEMSRWLKEGKPNPLVAKNVADYERLLAFVFVKKPFIPLPIKNPENTAELYLSFLKKEA